jgi:hypothetical protein
VVWILRLVQIGADAEAPFVDVMTINRPDDLDDIASLGLAVADGKRVLAGLQQLLVAGFPSLLFVRKALNLWYLVSAT